MKTTARFLAATTVFAAALGGVALGADNVSTSVFTDCDGYAPPSRFADGMTEASVFLGEVSPTDQGGGDAVQQTLFMGGSGVLSCDAALSHPALLPKYWIRRENILRAKAVHLLAANRPDEALKTLDEADALGRANGDEFHQRSTMLGSQLARASALRQKGQLAGAEALVSQALSARPYSHYVADAALLALGEAEGSLHDEVAKAAARLDPTVIETLFTQALVEGHYDDIVVLYRQFYPSRVSLDVPNPSYDYKIYLAANDARWEMFNASRVGPYAYALTALGRADEGRKAIADERSRLVEISTPRVPVFSERSTHTQAVKLAEYQTRFMVDAAKRGGESLDAWNRAIELRLLAEKDPAAAASDIAKGPPLPPRAAADVYQIIRSRAPGGAAATYPSYAELAAPALGNAKSRRRKVFADFLGLLPHAELADQLPPYREARHPVLAQRGSYSDLAIEGYREELNADTGVTTIRVRSLEGSTAVIEEMAVLRAAELAIAAGKPGFVILNRHNTRYVMGTTYYGQVISSETRGSSAELDVVFVDPAALPDQFRGAEWRVLDAKAVKAALGPLYIR